MDDNEYKEELGIDEADAAELTEVGDDDEPIEDDADALDPENDDGSLDDGDDEMAETIAYMFGEEEI